MSSVTTVQNLKSLEVEFDEFKVNVEDDLRAIDVKAWDPKPLWMLLPGGKKSDDWRILHCRLGARSTVHESFSYLFDYALDKVTGKLVGEPTLRLTFELADFWKPDSELIAEYEGLQALQLWNIVAGKFEPVQIRKDGLDSPMFEK